MNIAQRNHPGTAESQESAVKECCSRPIVGAAIVALPQCQRLVLGSEVAHAGANASPCSHPGCARLSILIAAVVVHPIQAETLSCSLRLQITCTMLVVYPTWTVGFASFCVRGLRPQMSPFGDDRANFGVFSPS